MYENIAYTVSAVGNKVNLFAIDHLNIIKILLHLLSLILPI